MSSFFPPSQNSPRLPANISTLLVKGPFHPSAPIHFCLSTNGASSILISPCRNTFAGALAEFNDGWLNNYGGDGLVASHLARIKVLSIHLSFLPKEQLPTNNLSYPPSPAHLIRTLSMLHCPQSSDAPHIDPKFVLDAPPLYIILHDISAFFLEDGSDNTYTVSSYLSLVAEALAAASFLATNNENRGSVGLVVFDSRLDQLLLPVVRPLPREDNIFGQGSERAEDTSLRKYSVATLAAKYFDWVGDFQTADESTGRFSLKLYDAQKIERNYHWYIRKEHASSDRIFIF